jgi:hypothetical protein
MALACPMTSFCWNLTHSGAVFSRLQWTQLSSSTHRVTIPHSAPTGWQDARQMQERELAIKGAAAKLEQRKADQEFRAREAQINRQQGQR